MAEIANNPVVVKETGDSGKLGARWQAVSQLPCELAIDVPLPGFTLENYLELRAGTVLESRWRIARELPVRVNGTLIGWAELEVSGSRLAVRVTELA